MCTRGLGGHVVRAGHSQVQRSRWGRVVRSHGDRERLQEAEMQAMHTRNFYRSKVCRLEEELRAARNELLTADEAFRRLHADTEAEFAPRAPELEKAE